jgi:hypothetical protein
VVSSGDRAHQGLSGSAEPGISEAQVGATELAQATWRKSTYSTYNGACVGFAVLRDDLVGVRDTKDADPSRALLFTGAAWTKFLADLRNGRSQYHS